ncbi:uridylate kinase [Methanothrix sp.]|jgi:aspartokinase-like uncharacterized kinase|uniref:amino acid kinase family protein n=1 Tax=Methanothrix sp. TaxID=90426 RepID=UPI001BD314F4
MPSYVLKLGGSLIDTAREFMCALITLAEEEEAGFLVLPGGGPFADLIRDIVAQEGLSEEAAHWMAVLAMEQYAYFLADGIGAQLTCSLRLPEKGEVTLLLPYRALTEEDLCPEHSWDYTSDSIALLVAARLGIPLIKVTDVDGVLIGGEVAEELAACQLLDKESCIDQGTIRLLLGELSGMRVWVLNGSDPAAFAQAFRSGKGGTFINGEKLSPSDQPMGRFIQ